MGRSIPGRTNAKREPTPNRLVPLETGFATLLWGRAATRRVDDVRHRV
jgi:hypothetical protein